MTTSDDHVVVVPAGADPHVLARQGGHRVVVFGPVGAAYGRPRLDALIGLDVPVLVVLDGDGDDDALRCCLHADVVVASVRSSVQLSDADSWGHDELALLAARAGVGAALWLGLLGQAGRLSISRAHQLGLVTSVVEQDAMAEAMRVAAIIAGNSPSAVARSREHLRWSVGRPLDAALTAAGPVLAEFYDHPDSTEGPRAFVERRSPRWEPPTPSRVASVGAGRER